jgi:hypothetical protein
MPSEAVKARKMWFRKTSLPAPQKKSLDNRGITYINENAKALQQLTAILVNGSGRFDVPAMM